MSSNPAAVVARAAVVTIILYLVVSALFEALSKFQPQDPFLQQGYYFIMFTISAIGIAKFGIPVIEFLLKFVFGN